MFRIGHGFDVHRLVSREEYLKVYPDRKNPELVLAGLVIPHEKVLLGHSDADLIIHALMDALLGAAALGDIGQHFPNTEKDYAQISSIVLLEKVRELLENENYLITNLDITVLAEKPKITKYIPQMKENLAKVLKINLDQINIKATTTEKLGFVGREEGMAAEAVSLITKSSPHLA